MKRTSFHAARKNLPPLYSCPSCGDTYAATVCPVCKIAIGPSFGSQEEPGRQAEEEGRDRYPFLFYI